MKNAPTQAAAWVVLKVDTLQLGAVPWDTSPCFFPLTQFSRYETLKKSSHTVCLNIGHASYCALPSHARTRSSSEDGTLDVLEGKSCLSGLRPSYAPRFGLSNNQADIEA